MRVLHVLDYAPPFGGGIVAHLGAFGTYLGERGHQLLAGFPVSREWRHDLAPDCVPLIIPSIRRPLRSGFAGDLGRLCRDHRVQLVHLHFSFALPASLAFGRFARRIPVVYHWHSPPKALQSDGRALRRTWAGWIARATDRRVLAHHFAVSQEIRDLLSRDRWTDEGKISVLPNALALSRARRSTANGAAEASGSAEPSLPIDPGPAGLPFTVGSVANLRPEKDHPTLLTAFAQVWREHPQARLVLVGDGPTRSALERQASALGIRAQVDFRGFVHDLSAVYPKFDLFVLSTRYEGQPYVLLEAMGHGLPIVATDLAPVRATLGEAFARYLSAPGDAGSMADAIRHLLHSPVERAALASAGRERAQREFSLPVWCGRLLELYGRLI